MKTKPLSLKIISVLLFVAPLASIAQQIWTNNWPLLGVRSGFWHFSREEWVMYAFYPVVAFGVFQIRRWSYFAFLGLTCFQVFKNGYAYYVTPSYSMYISLLGQLASMGIMGFFLRKHVVAPYFNPSLKWWVRSPRHEVILEAQVRIDDRPVQGKILDLSLTGCFVDVRERLQLGDLVWVHMSLNKMDFSIMGRVMRTSQKSPKGYGLMFLGMSNTEAKSLQRIIDYLLHSSRRSSTRRDDSDASVA